MQLHPSLRRPEVAVGYTLPAEHLRPYFSTYSLTEVEAGAGTVFDQVYPEWGNLRFSTQGDMAACTGPGPLRPSAPICGIGPTSHSTHFSIGPGRFWTVSILPLGWARLMAIPAKQLADRWEVLHGASPFARFAPLLDCVATEDAADAVSRIDGFLTTLLGPPAKGEEQIVRVHEALLDPDVTTVAALAERAGLSVRALERLAGNAFGFGPKMLLRRQRFLRSLTDFMLDPSLGWVGTMDSQYVDQAHFIRDFRRFMDTTPTAYAAKPHPVLWAAARARQAAAGAPAQLLQYPLSGAQRALR